MQIFRFAEEGSIRFLWITCTNPAVSLPELRRIRSILKQKRLFVVAQDIFPTETTALADVVLPAATWGEKTGTFTSADRTVHISHKATVDQEYRSLNPYGKAIITAADYVPPYESPSEEYPFLLLNTGRTLYHFHTRTKTARAPQLQAAAPDVWVEVSVPDAGRLGVGEGDVMEVASPRGVIHVPVRITNIRKGVVFVPFHYGYWDETGDASPDGRPRAANDLTFASWDPVSKQPVFKTAAVKLTRVAAANGRAAPTPTTTTSVPVDDGVIATTGGPAAEAVEFIGEGGAR